MNIIVKKTHEYFNLDPKINPIVKTLIGQPNGETTEEKISAITGKNYVKIQEQLELLTTLAKNLVRYEVDAFKENVGARLKVMFIFADFAELLDADLNFADTIAVNMDTYLVFKSASEQNINKVLTEFQRLYREFTQFKNYIDEQYKLYLTHIHDIVIMKCPGYVVEPQDNFPNVCKWFLRNLTFSGNPLRGSWRF